MNSYTLASSEPLVLEKDIENQHVVDAGFVMGAVVPWALFYSARKVLYRSKAKHDRVWIAGYSLFYSSFAWGPFIIYLTSVEPMMCFGAVVGYLFYCMSMLIYFKLT